MHTLALQLLTGRYAWRTWLKNGILLEHMPLLIEPDRLTVPEMLRQHGYTTACIGKWHLGWGSDIDPDWNGDVAPGPLECGFDYFFGLPFSHDSSPQQQVWVENRRIVGLTPGESVRDAATLQRVKRNMTTTAIKLADVAVKYLEDNQAHPFFLFLPTTNVHFPLTPGKRFGGKSGAGLYGDYIFEFDWFVGEVMKTLQRLNLANRTILIVTSDNGARDSAGTLGHDPNGPWRGTEDSYNLLPAMMGERLEKPIREATVFHSTTGVYAIRQGKWKMIEGQPDDGLVLPDVWNEIRKEARYWPVKDETTGGFADVRYDFRIQHTEDSRPGAQLFDLELDSGETSNVAAEHTDVVMRLYTLLETYRNSGRSRD